MYISWNWLSRHVALDDVDPHALIDRVTMSVAEVEGVTDVGAGLEAVIAGEVVAVEPHPNADRLKLVTVATGDTTCKLVCGAPNCKPGGVYPLALPGVELPGGRIEKTRIRGVESVGMLCSERDLGLSEAHGGLLVLDRGATPGARFTDLAPVTDVVFEIDNKTITHRPDLWCHRGMARELGVLLERPLEPMDLSLDFTDDDPLRVAIAAPDLCPRYTAARYSGVQVAPSPLWLRLLLERVDVRAISNIVDISNYVMLDVGNPIHAFDARSLRDDRIDIRRAEAGEVIRTLDDVERRLLGDDLVIADGGGAIALAGVMGGGGSEIRDDTTEVVLESANFHAATVRRTSLRVGLRTEASARFEKSLDPNAALEAQLAFGRVLQELVPGARVSSRLYDDDHTSKTPLRVSVPAGFIEKKLGTELPEGFSQRVLTGLGFELEARADGGMDVTIPSYRATKDVSLREDIVEEVGRLFGYDHIVPEPPRVRIQRPDFPLTAEARAAAAATLSLAEGFHQVQTYSFFSNRTIGRLGLQVDMLPLKNPISSDMTHMRTALAPNLLQVAEANHRADDVVRIFEIGRVFQPERDEHGLPLQPYRISALVWRKGASDEVYFEVKGAVEALVERFHAGPVKWKRGPAEPLPYLHPGKAAHALVGGEVLGSVALVHPLASEKLKLDHGHAAVAELALDVLTARWDRGWTYDRLDRYPGARYEISPIVPLAVTHQDLISTIRVAAGDWLRDVRFLVSYHGEPIPEGSKSVSFEMVFGRDDRTLNDDEVHATAERVMAKLTKAFGAYLREA